MSARRGDALAQRPDDLARIGADLVPPAAALAASAHYATDANLVPLTPLTKDRPCTNCGHVASHDPPGCAECFDEPAAGGLCQTYVPPASQQDATEPTPAEDWRARSVTAIAAENPAVAEHLADLEARLLSLATRVGGVLDALAPPRFVAKCATKGCIRPVFTYDGDLCARCIAALPGASSECPICHRDTPHSHSADAAAPSREMIANLQQACDRVAEQWAPVAESIAEAKAALAKVGLPHNPVMDKHGLYYPLLFLVQRIEEYDHA